MQACTRTYAAPQFTRIRKYAVLVVALSVGIASASLIGMTGQVLSAHSPLFDVVGSETGVTLIRLLGFGLALPRVPRFRTACSEGVRKVTGAAGSIPSALAVRELLQCLYEHGTGNVQFLQSFLYSACEDPLTLAGQSYKHVLSDPTAGNEAVNLRPIDQFNSAVVAIA